METHDEIIARRQGEYEGHARIFGALPGGAALVAAFAGCAPSFHDATLVDLRLSVASGKSTVRLSNPYPDIFARGRVIVTLTLGEVIDVDLQHFMEANILYRLLIKPAVQRSERRGYHRPLRENDLEIELEASVGVAGFVLCSGLTVSWTKDRRARLADRNVSASNSDR